MTNTSTVQLVVRNFTDALTEKLDRAQYNHFSSALRKIDRNSIPCESAANIRHEVPKYLDTLSKHISDKRFLSAVENLSWNQTYTSSEGIDSVITNGMFTAQVYRSNRVIAEEQITVGIFLVAPNVCYPLHTHEAAEVYYCLAGSVEITHRFDATPIRLRQEQCSVTPSGRLHALQTHEQPVLLAYVWTGNISAPNWWWEKQDDDSWKRTAWQRVPGIGWQAGTTELVTSTIFDEAMQ